MKKKLSVLIVEDSEDYALLEVRRIKHAGYDVDYRRVETPEDLEASLSSKAWDIVLSDFTMPHLEGMDSLKIVRTKDEFIPFIFVSGTIGEERAVAALKQGANDYVMKERPQRLVECVERELRDSELRIQRNKAWKELAASEKKYRYLFESAPVGYHEIDKDGMITRINRKELEMLGYGLKEVVGKPCWELFPVDPEAARERVLSKLAETAPLVQNAERVYVRKDRTTFFAVIDETLLRNEEGIVTGIRTVVLDVTDRKHAEENHSSVLDHRPGKDYSRYAEPLTLRMN